MKKSKKVNKINFIVCLCVFINNQYSFKQKSTIMFRNSYLDTYKHAVLYNKQVDFLFVHLSQIYSTLGSAINDLQYQFGLILSQNHQNNQNRQSDKNVRSSNKAPPYPKNSSSSEINQQNQFQQIQNRMSNFVNGQRKKLSQGNLQLKLPVFQIQSKKKNAQINQKEEKRNQRQSSSYNPIIESTQDFEALFLNPKEQMTNQTSNSRAIPSRPSNKPKQQSTGNNPQKSSKISQDAQIDFMDKLFRN